MISSEHKSINPRPGQCVQALYSPGPGAPEEIALFLRPLKARIQHRPHEGVQLRAGLVQYNDVSLVVTMVRVQGNPDEYFDIWWNYQSQSMRTHLDQLARQSKLNIHILDSDNSEIIVQVDNDFKRFLNKIPGILDRSPKWNDIEFDRAVRGFCADSYPRDNLWDLIELKPKALDTDTLEPHEREYKGMIPDELKSFYEYDDVLGHCIRIIPSTFEGDLGAKDPNLLLQPAPVKTVLRCGIRWQEGYPVAPIPFIPGHGLAVPPDDAEF